MLGWIDRRNNSDMLAELQSTVWDIAVLARLLVFLVRI